MKVKQIKAKPSQSCAKCKSKGRETFWYMRHRYLFDVDLARKIVSSGHQPMRLNLRDLRLEVESSELDEQHVAHVDPKIPGIISHIFFPEADGSEVHGHILIDGHHRAARALQLKQPFFAYILSEAESREVLLKQARRSKTTSSRKKSAVGQK